MRKFSFKKIVFICFSLLILVCIYSFCGRKGPSPLWSKNDVVVLYFKGPILVLNKWKKGIERVEVESGKTIWNFPTTEEVLVNKKSGKIFLLDWSFPSIREINPENGQTTDRKPIVKKEKNIEFTEQTLFYPVDGKIYFFKKSGYDQPIGVLDIETGQASALTESSPSSPDELYFMNSLFFEKGYGTSGERLIFYDLQSGHQILKRDTSCSEVIVSEDGDHVYCNFYQFDTDHRYEKNGEFDWRSGELVSVQSGFVRDISLRFKAIDQDKTLQIVENSSGKIFTSISSKSYFGAVKLFENCLFYFDAAGQSLWWKNLETGKKVRLQKSSSHFVITTDGGSGFVRGDILIPDAYSHPYYTLHDYEKNITALYRLPASVK